jgi:hypothetical protein
MNQNVHNVENIGERVRVEAFGVYVEFAIIFRPWFREAAVRAFREKSRYNTNPSRRHMAPKHRATVAYLIFNIVQHWSTIGSALCCSSSSSLHHIDTEEANLAAHTCR